MAEAKITGGFYIKARTIMHSAIMKAPPCTRELWDYLLLNACFTTRKVNGIILSRGQLHTSINEIINALSWQIGYRRESYSRDQMKTSLKTLRTRLMITLTKTPAGMLITICNYDYYQDPKNYETTSEATNENPTKPPRSHQEPQQSTENTGRPEPLKNDKNEIIKNIVDYLNLKSGKKFRHTAKSTIKAIELVINAGYTTDDWFKVIDIKSTQWLNTEMEKYLDPETLCRHFEKYLNEKPINGNKNASQKYTVITEGYKHV